MSRFILLVLAISTPYDNCTHGALRLVGGADNSQGRLEICINNAWGTVCREGFGLADAKVVCGQLGGFMREGMMTMQACI